MAIDVDGGVLWLGFGRGVRVVGGGMDTSIIQRVTTKVLSRGTIGKGQVTTILPILMPNMGG